MKEYGAALQNQPVDVSEEFSKQQNHFFVGSKVSEFDPGAASGKILWKHLALKQRVSYHQLTLQFEDYKVWEDTPPEEYEDQQALPFSLSFVTPRTVRLRMAARPQMYPDGPSLILDGDPPTDDSSWRTSSTESSTTYEGPFGSVTVTKDPATPSTRPPAACGWPTTCRPANCRAGPLGQDLDVPVRSMHADPLPVPDQPGGMLHPHDGRQAVLPCDHRAMGHQAPTSFTRPWIATNRGVQLGSV